MTTPPERVGARIVKPEKDPSAPTRSPHEIVVLTTRITPEERDRVRAAAGWCGLQKFVHDAVMTTVERARMVSQ